MANSWFRFKQFTVEQNKTAMKVGTDGVLLGAWTTVDGTRRILDVGTGTGLIALMLAQRNSKARIVAIDIDNAAVEQATENFINSPWKERLNASLVDFKDFPLEGETFDLIVSNPPFFKESLKPALKSRALARHDHLLSHEVLIDKSAELLTDDGRLCVILPYVEGSVFIALAAKKGLFCSRKTNVFPKPDSEIKRLLLEFSRIKSEFVEERLVIEDKGRHGYSKEYLSLTGDYYLFG